MDIRLVLFLLVFNFSIFVKAEDPVIPPIERNNSATTSMKCYDFGLVSSPLEVNNPKTVTKTYSDMSGTLITITCYQETRTNSPTSNTSSNNNSGGSTTTMSTTSGDFEVSPGFGSNPGAAEALMDPDNSDFGSNPNNLPSNNNPNQPQNGNNPNQPQVNGSNPNQPQVYIPPPPNIDIVGFQNDLDQCLDTFDNAQLCCSKDGAESCLQQSSEGVTMINDLTNAYAMAKSSGGGLRDQCSSVSTLQQKNMAMATYAKTQCDSKSNTCEVTCKNLYNKLTIAYGNECQMQPNHGLCQEAQTILSQSRGSANGCSNLTSSQGFVSSIAQNAAGLKIAKDCEEKLKNAEGNSFATMPFPPSQESTNVDCSVAANNSHPSCQIETQANQKSSTLPSGEISNGSENPSWFDPKTKTFDDPEDLAQKQFEEKMKAFREGSAKLDSQTQVARGTSSFAGGGLGGSDSSATTSLDPMPSTVAAPEFESQLFKYAGSRKGWSSNGGQWRSPSSTGSKISFSSFLKNEKKPTKIKHPWIGMNIKDLMSTSSKSKDLSLLHPNQWLFGVNSGFQYSLFKNGEPSFLSPHPMNRLKPREDFVGLVQLKAHHKASLLQHCALNSDPVLALNLDNKRLETISKNIVNFSQFNLSNRLNCKNRDLSKGKFQILKQSDLSPFSKGELFESEHFKLTLDNGFRADEKPPLWLFTNKTNEVFFTFTGKMKDVKIDNLITYKLFLDNPIVFKDLSGIDHASQPIKVVIQTIANQKWIDALHYNAEKNGYFTRYLATVYKNKAMVFTFNIHRNAYTKYSDKIAKMIASIRLDGTSPGINYRDEKLRKLYLSQNSKSTPIATNISSLDYDDNRQTSSVKHQSYNPFYMYLGLSILAISSLYYLFSRRRNRSK